MLDLYGCHFTYGVFDSSRYGLIFGNMDTSPIVTMHAQQDVNTIYLKKNHRHYLTSVEYTSDHMLFDAEIFSVDDGPIGESYLHEIELALFNQKSFKRLYGYQGPLINPVYLNCILINPERIESAAGVVGYKFTVVTDSVMAWEDTPDITATPVNHVFTVTVDSDLDDYIYPDVQFTVGSSGGDVTLYNSTDDATRFTSFSSLPASTLFTMYGSINHISNDMYQYFTDRNFIRLLNGENSFYITGDITSLRFSFSNRKYL